MDKIYTEKHEVHRHEHIQIQKQYLNAPQINVAVNLALKNSPSILPPAHQNPINSKIDSLTPMRFGLDFDKNRARLAFGSQALTKLIHEIGSMCIPIKNKALLVLVDVMYDPFERNRAIEELHVVKRLEDVFFKCIPERKKTIRTIELCMMNLNVIANTYIGADKIIKQHNLIDTIYEMIVNKSAVAILSSTLLSKLSSFRLIGEEMLYYDHLKKLKLIFDTNPESHHYHQLYEHLDNLIILNPSAAIEAGYFEFLISKIQIPNNELIKIMVKSIAHLISCTEGHKRFDQIDGIKTLHHIAVNNHNNDQELYKYLALGFMNCTFTKAGIWRAREFWDLPHILVKWCYVHDNSNLQLYALQTLRQITSLPCIKNFVRRTLKSKIINIQCENLTVESKKTQLLEWLRKKIYSNIIEKNTNSDDNDDDEEHKNRNSSQYSTADDSYLK